MPRLLVLLLALCVVASGCDGADGDEFASLLGAGERLPPVQLSETSPLLDVYDPSAAAVRGARVTITLLTPDGTDEQTTPYTADSVLQLGENQLGLYLPDVEEPPMVLPGRTYRLDVEAEGQTLRAFTTVPATVELVEEPTGEVVYGIGRGPAFRITRTSTPGRQAAFVASTRALAPAEFRAFSIDGEIRYRSVPDPATFLPVPLYQRFFHCEPEEGGTILCDEDPLANAVVGTSPVINEESYIDLGDGTVRVQVPFLAFGFYGPHRISLVSVDAALQAFVETQVIQGGGATLSPGEIPNVTTNVEGGLGVFGSFSRVIVQTTLVER
jgi:hypothetical protein